MSKKIKIINKNNTKLKSNQKLKFQQKKHNNNSIPSIKESFIAKNRNGDRCWIYGFHPVRETLLNCNKIHSILITDKAKHKLEQNIELKNILQKYSKITKITALKDFSKYLDVAHISNKSEVMDDSNLNHQGIAVLIDIPKILKLDDFIFELQKDNDIINKVAILDQITDIGNIGAIIRSAAAFGIKYIFVSEYNSCTDYNILSKSSAGMINRVKIFQVSNYVKLLDILKEYGFWCAGLDAKGSVPLSDINSYKKLAIILGNENKGIRSLVKQNCDLLTYIPISKEVESINVSNAASIVFFMINTV